jgi:hypothetical protein
MDIAEAADKVGVTVDTVKVGENADWTSPFKQLTPKQEAAVDSHVEMTYRVRYTEPGSGGFSDPIDGFLIGSLMRYAYTHIH